MRPATLAQIDKEVDNLVSGIIVTLTRSASQGYLTGRIGARQKVNRAVKKQQEAVTNEAKPFGSLKLGMFNPQVLTEATTEYARTYRNNLLENGEIIGNVITKNDAGGLTMATERIPWLGEVRKNVRSDIIDIIQEGLVKGKYPGIRESKTGTYPKGTIAYDLQDYANQWKSRASTIARTESTRHIWNGQVDQYRDDGVTRLQWLCGDEPCAICQMMCGQIFNIDSVVNIPVHPNCTCDTAPLLGTGLEEQEPLAQVGTRESGNWGHEGRPGEVGGSKPGVPLLSIRGKPAKVRGWDKRLQTVLTKQTAMYNGLLDRTILREVDAYGCTGGWTGKDWAEASTPGVIYFNDNLTSDPAKFQREMNRCVTSKMHPAKCNSVKALVDHEAMHQLIAKAGIWDDELRAESETFDKLSRKAKGNALSIYAGKDGDEFLCEAWCEYMNNPKPRPLSKRVGDHILSTINSKRAKKGLKRVEV